MMNENTITAPLQSEHLVVHVIGQHRAVEGEQMRPQNECKDTREEYSATVTPMRYIIPMRLWSSVKAQDFQPFEQFRKLVSGVPNSFCRVLASTMLLALVSAS